MFGIILKFAGTVFSRSPLLKATDDIFSRHTAFVCGGNPCSEGLLSHVQFLVTVPNLQAGAHGILDPPCATKLRSWMGYQGWSPWRTCNWPRCSFIIQAFWWLSGYYFVICMNNSRNRSPLRIFQYLPISATFVQCGQRRPSWTMHVNSKFSSGALSGMKRLIDEIRSFKCVSNYINSLSKGWSFCGVFFSRFLFFSRFWARMFYLVLASFWSLDLSLACCLQHFGGWISH